MNLSAEIISKAVQSVIDGEESACKIYALLKNLSVQIASGLKVIQSPVMEEAREFNKDEKYFGGAWSFSSTGNTLNYSDDPIFNELKEKLADRQEDLKNAFTANQKGLGFHDGDSGELIPVVSIKKVSVETIKFTPK